MAIDKWKYFHVLLVKILIFPVIKANERLFIIKNTHAIKHINIIVIITMIS